MIVYHHLFLSYQQSTEYEIVLGRKNVAVKLIITFDKKDCFHLMGDVYKRQEKDRKKRDFWISYMDYFPETRKKYYHIFQIRIIKFVRRRCLIC